MEWVCFTLWVVLVAIPLGVIVWACAIFFCHMVLDLVLDR